MSDPLTESVKLTVLIPCLNEELAIGRVVRNAVAFLEGSAVSGEVLVVDNGSTDASVQIARHAGARVVHEPRTGYGNAVRRGISEALGAFIIMADGDDTYPVSNLGPFLDHLEAGYDLLIGNRFGSIQPGAMAWSHRYIGTPLLSMLLRVFAQSPVTDSQSGMRGFRADAMRALDLRSSGMELSSEMLVRACKQRWRVGEVNITLSQRTGESKLQTLPDGWRHMRYLLAMSPDYLFIAPGLLLVAASIVLMVIGGLHPEGFNVGARPWQPRFASLITGALGAQLLWFGILAKIFLSTTDLARSGWLTDWFLRVFTLERALAASIATLATGLVTEVLIAFSQFGPPPQISGLDIGLLGAFLLIIGGQSFFGSFLAYAITSEYLGTRRAAVQTEDRTRVGRELPAPVVSRT